MTALIRSMGERYELYRVVLDYEALQESFLDRIDDLNTTFTEIDAAGGFTRGNAQRLLTKSEGKPRKDRPSSSSKRTFGWESLRKMLKGTGTVLAVLVDRANEPADLKPRSMRGGAVILKRKRDAAREVASACGLSMAVEMPETTDSQAQIERKEQLKMWGQMGGKASAKRRMKKMGKRARQRIAQHAARKRWHKDASASSEVPK